MIMGNFRNISRYILLSQNPALRCGVFQNANVKKREIWEIAGTI